MSRQHISRPEQRLPLSLESLGIPIKRITNFWRRQYVGQVVDDRSVDWFAGNGALGQRVRGRPRQDEARRVLDAVYEKT